uniref:tetratricopeptide repeat protein n=1 Tax=Anaplasma marginale TaxID=770 RepID=UPI0005B3900E
YHPDLHPDNPDMEEKFKSIAIAYQFLRDSLEIDRNSNKDVSVDTTSDNYRDFYVRGIQSSLERDYQRALENFTKAIELKKDFFAAYLKRCETLYRLGDDRGVLRDCEELLKLDRTCVEAHYYRGRSRYRLGYAAAAVEAYTEAINISNSYAEAYYYRGLAKDELQESN